MEKSSFELKNDNHTYKVDVKFCANKMNANPDVNLEPIGEYIMLSIIGYGEDGDVGQIHELLKEEFPNDSDVQRFCDLWGRWHLNGLTAGSTKQEEFIRAYQKEHPEWRYDYTEACQLLEDADLFVDLGYNYGHKWLVEEIPNEVLEEIKSLVKKFNA
jgi:hypothetical protein